jgi:hypothetical protein
MTSDVRCTCVIKKAPTYEVYVQTPCGIHRRMVEGVVENCSQIAEGGRIISGDTPGPLYDAGWNAACAQVAKWIRETQEGGKR